MGKQTKTKSQTQEKQNKQSNLSQVLIPSAQPEKPAQEYVTKDDLKAILNECFGKVSDTFHDGLQQVREEIKESNKKLEEKIEQNQDLSIKRMDSMETKFGDELVKINDNQKKSARNKNGFTNGVVERAKENGIDLENISFMFNGFNLLSIDFKPHHANLLGTRLLGVLYTNEEIQNGTLNPKENDFTLLDGERINLLKAVYIYKMGLKEFLDSWTVIEESLKQKIRDSRKSKSRKHSKAAGINKKKKNKKDDEDGEERKESKEEREEQEQEEENEAIKEKEKKEVNQRKKKQVLDKDEEEFLSQKFAKNTSFVEDEDE